MQKNSIPNDIAELLLSQSKKRNQYDELDLFRPDPLFVARQYNDEYIALICALFSYGNAKAIVNFLLSLDFSLLSKSDAKIENNLLNYKYRFQSTDDILEIFKTIKKAKSHSSLESIFYEGYSKKHSVMDGLNSTIDFLYSFTKYSSNGFQFYFGKSYSKTSTYKRWNMFLRWMVRKDYLDMGLWKKIQTKDLLMPLDTHTFNVAKRLGLLQRKQYDFQAVEELTATLRILDTNDPVRFDFALYRLGQEGKA